MVSSLEEGYSLSYYFISTSFVLAREESRDMGMLTIKACLIGIQYIIGIDVQIQTHHNTILFRGDCIQMSRLITLDTIILTTWTHRVITGDIPNTSIS
jgi:hypothetical protein